MYVCMVNLTASDVDGERTIGVLTKVDIMDHGTDCCDILLGMYVCMIRYIHTYACMYIYMHVFLYISMHVCL